MKVRARMSLVLWMVGWMAMAIAVFAQAPTTVQIPYAGSAPVPQTVPYGGTVPITVVCPSGTPTVAGTTVTCPPVTPPIPPIPPTNRTKVIPSGGNDATNILNAAAKGPIELGCGATTGIGCTFQTTSITFPAGTDLLCDDGVTVSDMPGFSSYAVLWQATAAGKFAGATDARTDPNACKLTMPNSFKANAGNTNQSTNQYNHCFQFYKAANVTFTGFQFANCGGDSIYIQFSTGITINGVNSQSPTRNGLSATDQNSNIVIEHSIFANAKNLKVAGIADGVDIEPNGIGQGSPIAGQFVSGVTLVDVSTPQNQGDGVCFCFYFINSTTPVTASMTNGQSTGNGLSAYLQDSWPSAMNALPQLIVGNGNMANGVPVAFPAGASVGARRHKLN